MPKIDQWLIVRAQWGYDYLLDRFGIYVGQVGQFLWVTSFGLDIMRGKVGVGHTVFTLIIVALLEVRNLMQRHGKYEHINACARESRNGRFYLVFRWGFVALMLTLQGIKQDILGMIDTMIFMAFMFHYCLMVRDRDESRFKEHKLVYQGSQT